jgi:hypothetical protein
MDRETQLRFLKTMAKDLNQQDLDAVYHLVWALTTKDTLLEIAKNHELKHAIQNEESGEVE